MNVFWIIRLMMLRISFLVEVGVNVISNWKRTKKLVDNTESEHKSCSLAEGMQRTRVQTNSLSEAVM